MIREYSPTTSGQQKSYNKTKLNLLYLLLTNHLFINIFFRSSLEISDLRNANNTGWKKGNDKNLDLIITIYIIFFNNVDDQEDKNFVLKYNWKSFKAIRRSTLKMVRQKKGSRGKGLKFSVNCQRNPSNN